MKSEGTGTDPKTRKQKVKMKVSGDKDWSQKEESAEDIDGEETPRRKKISDSKRVKETADRIKSG